MLNFSSILPSIPYILEGLGVTLTFTILSLLGGLPLGLLLGLFKAGSYRYLRLLADFYTSVFRGTPLLVQLGLFYYGIPQLTGYTMSAFEAAILTFSLNSAAYTSEIIRSGIQAIDPGQWEAAQILGLSRLQTFKHIIFPLTFRNILPNMVNEIIDLFKETALVSIIGEADLLRRAQIVAAEKFLYFEPYIISAFIYYIIVLIISYFAKKLEKGLRYA